MAVLQKYFEGEMIFSGHLDVGYERKMVARHNSTNFAGLIN